MTGPDLRAWRSTHKIALNALGEALERSVRTLRAYERGELPVPRHIVLACERLGYPEGWSSSAPTSPTQTEGRI